MNKKILNVFLMIFSFFLGVFSVYLVINTKYTNEITEKTITEYKIEETAVTEAIEKAIDSVVVIETYKNNRKTATGTGFVYKKDDKKGYIVTNAHVISDSDSIKVIFTNKKEEDAILLGKDEYADIAVLSVNKDSVLETINIGTSEDKKIGTTVLTIGAPMGSEYSGSITKGILSGKNRAVTVTLTNGDWIMEVLQTDAAINPGNSGGPLIDLSGSVIGITSLKIASSKTEGMGFAIPIEEAMKYIQELEQGNKIRRPLLGIEMLELTDAYRLYIMDIEVDKSIESGVVIANVIDKTPADTYKLEKGDVLLEINNVKIKSIAEFRYELYKNKPKDTINIKLYRNKEIINKDIILSSSD